MDRQVGRVVSIPFFIPAVCSIEILFTGTSVESVRRLIPIKNFALSCHDFWKKTVVILINVEVILSRWPPTARQINLLRLVISKPMKALVCWRVTPQSLQEIPAKKKSFRDDEMERPWPATFERSISLLASPMINAEEADHYTKSPKPGNTPLAERRRMVSFGFVSLSRFSVFSLDTHLSFGSSELPKPLMEHCYGHWEN